MVELDLRKLMDCLIWELKVLAAVRRACADHGIETGWLDSQEGEVAKLHESLRMVVKMRGDVLCVREKAVAPGGRQMPID